MPWPWLPWESADRIDLIRIIISKQEERAQCFDGLSLKTKANSMRAVNTVLAVKEALTRLLGEAGDRQEGVSSS